MDRKLDNEIIEITLADFERIQNTSAILSDESKTLRDFFSSLSGEAKKSIDKKESHILWLLSDVSGIYIKDNSKNVFGPMFTFCNGRSAIPDDFTDKDLDFFEIIFEKIINKNLKARIGDMLWYLKRKHIEYVQFVISYYLSLSIDYDSFYDNKEFVIRGLYLANQILNEYSKNEISNFENNIFYTFNLGNASQNAYLVYLAEIMRSFNMQRDNSNKIILKLLQIAKDLSEESSVFLAGNYYDEASKWALLNGEREQSVEYQITKATLFINAADKTSGIQANSHYETALQIIQSQPKNIRRKFISEEEEKKIIIKLEQSGIECLAEMKPFNFEFSIPNQTNEMNKLFLGKTKDECLKNLASLPCPVNFDSLLEASKGTISDSPITYLCKSRIFNDKGLVISAPNSNNFDNLNEKDTSVVNMMHNIYLFSIQTFVLADITIALKDIISEHRITYEDIIKVVYKSNIIPKERVEIFSKGLLAGFDFDFITSIHLLVPQFENLIRFHLKNAGVVTFTYDNKKEIEDEASINKYVETKEFEDLFGKNWAFEIKALLVEKTGCNFRNKLAHGTLSENEMKSTSSIYFWWLCFKLVYLQFANTLRKEL